MLDELVFGAREAAWPLIRDDLSLSYTQIGLLLSVPNLVSLVVEPVLGVAAVTWRRRALVVGGGLAFRWLFLLELSDLLGDVLLGFLALYFVDAVGSSPATGGLAVAVWSGAGLVGAGAMIPLLRRVDGLSHLRASAAVSAVLFAGLPAGAGGRGEARARRGDRGRQRRRYPVLQARLYGALEGKSGLVLTAGALFPLNAVLPLAIAAAADRWGLDAALWPLLAAPVALILLVPRER
ncbi:MAG: hypothetical protein ACXWZB_09615 [Gaiellaceae bacterium]